MSDISLNSYRIPAEWEKHHAIWLAWPHDKITFGSLNQQSGHPDEGRLAKVEREFIKIITTLAESEQVNLIILPGKKISDLPKGVKIFEADYADVWTRDYMPTFVKNQNDELTAVKWEYNAYGEKFAGLKKDNNVWSKINLEFDINTIKTGIILETGAIEVNGNGVLITTLQCLLKRNPNLNKKDYEEIFAKFLNIKKVVWLKEGLTNDHTDGHVDNIVKFVTPNKILSAYENNREDENYEILKNNFETLKNAINPDGKPFEIVKLPMPHMNYNNGKKTPVSYANFYIGNTVVLVPIFNDANDSVALEIIQSCFPERKIIGIDCREIIYGGGSIHCITQQQPVGLAKNKK